jgi:hypothetical protein
MKSKKKFTHFSHNKQKFTTIFYYDVPIKDQGGMNDV